MDSHFLCGVSSIAKVRAEDFQRPPQWLVTLMDVRNLQRRQQCERRKKGGMTPRNGRGAPLDNGIDLICVLSYLVATL
jgi:hypothetical protein